MIRGFEIFVVLVPCGPDISFSGPDAVLEPTSSGADQIYMNVSRSFLMAVNSRQSAADKKGTFILTDNQRLPAEKEIDAPTKQLFDSFVFFNRKVLHMF